MFRDLTGQRFGRLIVLGRDGKNEHRAIKWKCQCDCGNITVTHGRDLINGHCKSCGCILNEHRREDGKYKGLSETRPFRIWKGMIDRCNNPKNGSYSDYGGRGISVCDEWQGTQGFFNFLSWVLNNGYADNLSIDRIDNNSGYKPSNCR